MGINLTTAITQLRSRLHETLAKLRLNEEMRKMETIEDERKAEEEIARRKRELEARNAKVAARNQAAADKVSAKCASLDVQLPFRGGVL